jgi:hypothetical protein
VDGSVVDAGSIPASKLCAVADGWLNYHPLRRVNRNEFRYVRAAQGDPGRMGIRLEYRATAIPLRRCSSEEEHHVVSVGVGISKFLSVAIHFLLDKSHTIIYNSIQKRGDV